MDAVRTDEKIAFHGEPFTRRKDKACFDLEHFPHDVDHMVYPACLK